MNKKRNFSRLIVASILLLIAIVTSSFVSCSYEINEDDVLSTVSFVPTVSKSLNQNGTSQSTSDQNVDLYHWQYAIALDSTINY